MSGPRFCFAPQVFELEGALDPLRALRCLRGARARILLHSAGGDPARTSLLAFDPLAGSALTLEHAGQLDRVRQLLARMQRAAGPRLPFFDGGFVGALSYDLGSAHERLDLPREPWGLPLAVGALYCDFLLFDHARASCALVLGEQPGDARPSVAERRARVLGALAREPAPEVVAPLAPVERCTTSAEHCRRVERARARIAEGEIYQANLAHRFVQRVRGTPEAWYARLVAANQAPYMGFAELGEGAALLSASPELLLELEGGEARTRPIKGTLAREREQLADREAGARLLASAKDRAELAMIVDLERNDLGRLSLPGGVRVEGFPTLRSYARVHHLTADVVGRLRPGLDACEVLSALFPGGSITGAPKLRAMEVIAELEGEGRGFFCGSLGAIDLCGRAHFNILIRTLLWRARPELGAAAGEISFRVGGGVTWSSKAEEEERETLAKAASLLEALQVQA